MPNASTSQPTQPVLILGGGIHGAAVARELALNGVSVVLIDANDLAAGATSKSSRLIHGGCHTMATDACASQAPR